MELITFNKDYILAKENSKYFKATWRLENDTPTLEVLTSRSKFFKSKVKTVTKPFEDIRSLYTYLVLFFGLSTLDFELEITNGTQTYTYNRLCLFIGKEQL